MAPKVLAPLILAVCFLVNVHTAVAAETDCRQGEVVLSHKHRHAGLTNSETNSLSTILAIVEQKQNMVRGADFTSASRAGSETPGICPAAEKICLNLTRKAKRAGREQFQQLHHLSCSYNYKIQAAATPNDLSIYNLWGLSQAAGINAPAAWNYTTGSSDVVVAVIDTGIDYNHPDLAANIWTNPSETAANGIDDDGDGYKDDVHGINAITGAASPGNPLDDNNHGTHVAGTIGAVGNNGVGVVGVNWNVKLLGIKVLSASGSGLLSDAVKGINYMVDLKLNHNVPIKVANNSWGFSGAAFTPLDTAIKAARDAGIIFVAAAGNSNTNNDVTGFYPANTNSANMISVGAIGQTGTRASFSNYGTNSVHIAAPGVGIYSTITGNRYASFSGTSMASPHVAGAVALVAAANPNLDWQGLRDAVLGYATHNTNLDSYVIGGRQLNIGAAVAGVIATPPPAAPTSIPTVAPTSTPTPVVTAQPTPAITPTPTPTPKVTPKPKKKPKVIKKRTPAQKRAARKRAAARRRAIHHHSKP